MTWKNLFKLAKSNINERQISPFIHGGNVACAIETNKGNIYVGINFDTSCDLGSCAERNAIRTMITNGETKIVKLVTVGHEGIRLPCGACRESLMQLHKGSGKMKILLNEKTLETITLNELLPNWWGAGRFN